MVRAMHFAADMQVLATMSEDCMVKLWYVPGIDQKQVETKGNVEPYITLRGHTGSIMCASGRQDTLFTGGQEGIVKMWLIPPIT